MGGAGPRSRRAGLSGKKASDCCWCTDISLSCARLPPFQPYGPRPSATSAGAPIAHRLGPMGLFHMKCSGTVYPDSIVLECKSLIFEGKNSCERQLHNILMLGFVYSRARLDLPMSKNGTGGGVR
jgi:hypothetical protein